MTGATEKDFDHIVIGAGSGGCAVVGRLTEDPDARVLLLEAGGWDTSPWLSIPLGWGQVYTRKLFDWRFQTEPEPALNNRAIECARGMVIGGSSSTNALGYVRGHAGDYDRWASAGLDRWSYADVLPYFRKQESWEGGADFYRGGDGPLTTRTTRYSDPLIDSVEAAAVEAGLPLTPDYNGAQQEGFGRVQQTVRNGRRCSSAVAYLRPALGRSNLTVVVRAMVLRVLIERGRVTGVEYAVGGKTQIARASSVVLAAGVIKTPHLLMLSGIGNADDLKRHGIEPSVDLPGVGQNLRDHISPIIRFRRSERGPLHARMRYDRVAFDMARAFVAGTGPASDVPSGVMGFVRTDQAGDLPDLQILLNAAPLNARPYLHQRFGSYDDGMAFRIVLLRPTSSGTVSLASGDPVANPVIRQNFLSDPKEWATLRSGLRLLDDMVSRNALRTLHGAEIDAPADRSDAALDASIRARSLTTHHPLGTCRMGADGDPGAVVDAELRVLGVEGLRIADASVMPDMVGGNINAPIIMIAERVADFIRGRPQLARADMSAVQTRTPLLNVA